MKTISKWDICKNLKPWLKNFNRIQKSLKHLLVPLNQLLEQHFWYSIKRKTPILVRKYTLLWVYASSLSQAGGTHSWWVLLAVRGEKHTLVKILCFGLNWMGFACYGLGMMIVLVFGILVFIFFSEGCGKSELAFIIKICYSRF